jgi:hypothetical protein
MRLAKALAIFLQNIQLDKIEHDGVVYRQCRVCKVEWLFESGPDWWKCPNGCNAGADSHGSQQMKMRRAPRRA